MIEVTASSGNVFADLGLPNAPERLAKARMAQHIAQIISEEGMTQSEAARRTGLTQPNVSDLTRGKLKGFSLDRLIQCLDALGQEVEITIRPKREAADQGGVLVAP